MIQQAISGMISILFVKFMLNDVPHAAGLYESGYDEPPTDSQIRYIAILCMRKGIKTPYEEQVKTKGEAGRLIRELEGRS